MPFSATVHHGPYLRAEGAGPATLSELIGYVEFVSVITRRESYQRVLLDLAAVEIDLALTEHISLGTYASGALIHLQKVASVVDVKYRSGASEKAAQNSGLNIRTFTSLSDAAEWLEAA